MSVVVNLVAACVAHYTGNTELVPMILGAVVGHVMPNPLGVKKGETVAG